MPVKFKKIDLKKINIFALGLSFGLFFAINAWSQTAPNITYTPSTNTYTVGTLITPLSLVNSGGSIDPIKYGTATTLTGTTFNGPAGLAIDPSNNIYIANYNGPYIRKFNSSVVYQNVFGTATLALTSPNGIAFDSAGNAYIVDTGTGSGSVYKYTNGVYQSTVISGLSHPLGIDIDASNNIYVTDYSGGSNTVRKYSSSGTVLLTLPSTNLNGPDAVAVDASGNIYVVNRFGNNVTKYSAAGAYLGTIVTGLNTPFAIAVDSYGTLFVGDSGNNQLKVYSQTGSLYESISVTDPEGIVSDNLGNLYVSNFGGNTVYKIPTTGSYFLTGSLPAGLSFDATTGKITGTPTTPTTAAGVALTVTCYNGTNSSTASLTVIVNPAAPAVAGTVTLCGTGSTTLTASGGLPTGGVYNWYPAVTGGTAIASTAAYTPFIGGTTTLYVAYTPTGLATSARAAVSITVNPLASSAINSPMLSYPFNGNANDFSGNVNNGTLQGAALPTLAADRNGLANNAYVFSGTNAIPQYISTTTSYAPLIFSFSVWFKTTVGGGKIIGLGGNQTGSNATQDRNLYMSSTGQLYFGVFNTVAGVVTVNTTTTYIDGLWHHAIATLGAGGIKIYVDGVLRASNATYFAPQGIAGYWRVGGDSLNGWTNRPTNDYFTGTIDDVAIYNHELSATEAASNEVNLYNFSTGYCANNPLTITIQAIPGASYSWTDNATPAFTGTGNPVTFASASATNYTLTTTVSGCTQSTALISPTGPTFTWTGAGASTTYNSAANWTNTSTGIAGIAPTTTGYETIVIPTGLAVYPVLNASQTIYNLNMASGSSLSLNGFTLNIGCNIVNSSGGQILYGPSAIATAAANASGITWNGSGTTTSQTYSGSAVANTAQLGTMTLNNTSAGGTLTINSGSLDIYSALNITSGNLAVASTGTLTLKSNASQSAAVGIIPSANAITGLVNVERFLTGGGLSSNRGYRLLSSPVNQTQSTSSLTNSFGLNYLNNHVYRNVTYAGAFTAGLSGSTNGFSLANANPTIYVYKENLNNNNALFTSGKNVAITKITTTNTTSLTGTTSTIDVTNTQTGATAGVSLPVGNGFLMYFVGPSTRTDGSAATAPADATMTAGGYINQQNVTVNLWYSPAGGAGKLGNSATLLPGYNMVGNPYASTINLATVLTDNNSLTGIDNIYLLSAKNSPNQTYTAYTANGTSAPLGTGGQGYAVSGEGFIVHAKSSAGTSAVLTFKETEKAPTVQLTGTSLIMSAPENPTVAANINMSKNLKTLLPIINTVTTGTKLKGLTGFFMKMEKDSATYDYCGIYFGNQWNSIFEDGDARDLDGAGPRVYMSSFSSDGIRSAVKHFPDYTKGADIKLYADAKTDGMYNLKIEDIQNIDTNNYKVMLHDYFKHDSLDIGKYKSYAFNILKSDTSTFGGSRFKLSIQQIPGSKYQLASFTAQKAVGGTLITWRTYNESGNYFFTLEKQQPGSTDYLPLYQMQSDGATNYKYTDKLPANGNNIYRLKQVDLFGNISYSAAINIYYDKSGSANLFSVYPNPSVQTININVSNGASSARASNYKLNIYDVSGTMVMQKISGSNTWSEDVSKFKPGVYIIQLKSNDDSSLGEIKFLKK